MAQEISLKFNAQLAGGAKAVFTSLSNGLKQVAKGFQVLAKEQIKLGNKGAATALNETAKGLKKYTKEIDKTVKSQDKLTKSNKKTKESTKKLSTAFSSLGKSIQTYSRYMVASNLILGVIGGFKASTAAVIEYDQALHDLKAITLSSATETDMMGKTIVEVAQLTKFSMGEVGGAMKKLAQAGFSATEITGMIGHIANLATGSLESLDVTVKLVSTAIRVFGMEMKDTEQVVDIFSNAVNKSRLTVSGLNTTFNYIGPIAAATGLSLKDTSASMMLLANSGLRFSTIGTGLRRIIGGLAKPSGRFKDAILEAGYTLADFNPNLTSFRDILEKLPHVVKNSTDAIEFFGYRGSSVISAFATQGVEEYDRLRAATNRVGTTSEMAAVQMQGLQNAIKNIKDRFGVLAKTLSEGGLLTIMKALVSAVRSLLSALIVIAGHPLGQAIMGFGLLATAIAGATAAIIALKTVASTAFFTSMGAQLASLHTKLSIFGAASLTTSAGILTLKSAVLGASKAFLGLLLNPVVLALSAVTLAVIGTIAAFKNNEKALRTMAIENEKYSSSLASVQSKLEKYKKIVAENGVHSEKAKKAALSLRTGVSELGEAYEGIIPITDGFLSNVDATTGAIKNQEETVNNLSAELKSEFIQSTLAAVAAAEKLETKTKSGSFVIRIYETALAGVLDKFRQLKKVDAWLGKIFGFKLDTDPLMPDSLDEGITEFKRLSKAAKDGSEKAAASVKVFQEGGKKILDVLLQEEWMRENLKDLTREQIKEAILGMADLTDAQKISAAAAIEAGVELSKVIEATQAKSKKDKEMADISNAYKEFGLTIGGTSKKLNVWMNKLKALTKITGKHKASSSDLVAAFRKVGNQVKSVAGFAKFNEAMDTVRESGRLTTNDLLQMDEITKKVYDSIMVGATGMREVLNATLDEYYQRVGEKAKRDLETGSTELKKQYDDKVRFITKHYKLEDTILTLKHQAYVNYYSNLSALEEQHSIKAERNINAEFSRKKQALQYTITDETLLNTKIAELEKERLKLVIANFEERKTKYTSMIDELIKEEDKLTDKIKDEQEFRKDTEKTTDELVRNLKYKTITTQQKILAEEIRMREIHKKAKDAYFAKDFDKAKKLFAEEQKGYNAIANMLEKKGGSEAKYFNEINKYANKIKTIGKDILKVSEDEERSLATQKDNIVTLKKELETSAKEIEKSIEASNAQFDELITGSVKKIIKLNKNISDINDIDISKPMEDLEASTNKTLKAVDKLLAKLAKVKSASVSTGGTPATGMKTGGAIPGYGGGDKVPAMLEQGEFVIRKENVKKYGIDLFQKFNQGLISKVQAFSAGGVVPKEEGVAPSFFKSVAKSMPSLSSVAGAIQSGFNSVRTGSEMSLEGLKDFGRLKLQTNDSEFSVIAHKDVVAQLSSHLQEVRRFAT